MTGIDRFGQNFGHSPSGDPDWSAKQLGQALRDLINKAGKSYSQLAPEVPCGKSTIADAVSGDPNRAPSQKIIEGICKACDADEATTTRVLGFRDAIRPKNLVSGDPGGTSDAAEAGPTGEQPAGDGGAKGSSNRQPDSDAPVLSKWWLAPGLVTACVVVLVVAGVLVWRWWPNGCGSGMRFNDQFDGECIGITDGSYLFNDPRTATNDVDRNTIEQINDVQKRIEIENNAVAATNRYVKVALLAPLTVSHDKGTLPIASLKEILRTLEGGYTALYRVNHSSFFGDQDIKIQLLLVNQGSQQNADPDFLNFILEASQPSHPVVAVIGLGSSLPNTKTAADYLAEHEIPMVSAVAAADNLTDLPLLWSVSPSAAEYVNRIHSFLQTNEEKDALKSGIIVYDLNTDYFTQSLARDFHSDDFKPYVKFPDQGFRGATQRGPAQTDVFVPMVTNLCDAVNDPKAPLNMVFYAGRPADLKAFAEALTTRICQNQTLTVLTATTAFPSVLDSVQQILQGGNVKVVVATSADPTAPGYPDFLKTYQTLGFKEDLDGYTIEYHDALVTAAKAIRLAGQDRPTQLPTPQDVAVQLGNLNLSYAVPGASGILNFQPQGGRARRPPGQSIPIKKFG